MKGREKAIADLREWARNEIEFGAPVPEVYRGLHSAMSALLEEFRVEHDVPGTRYWLHWESNCYFSTEPGEELSVAMQECDELARHEFLSRQRLHFGYKDRL